MNPREKIAISWQIILLVIATMIAFAWLLAYQVTPAPLTLLDSKISEHMPDYSFIGVSLYQVLSIAAGIFILVALTFATSKLLPLIFKNRLTMLLTALAASGAFWVLCKDYQAGIIALSIYAFTYFSMRIAAATGLWSNLEYIRAGRRTIYALVFAFIAATFLATDPAFVAQVDSLLNDVKNAIPSNSLFGFNTSFMVSAVATLIAVVAAITIGGRFFAVVMYHWVGPVSLTILFLLFGHEKIGLLLNLIFNPIFASTASIWPVIKLVLLIAGGVVFFSLISDGTLGASIIQNAKNKDPSWGDKRFSLLYSSHLMNIHNDDDD